MATKEGRRSRSRASWALFGAAQVIKLVAAGLAVYEMTGELRPEGLAFAAFLLTVAQSFDTTSNSL